jgi:hypothetical protein
MPDLLTVYDALAAISVTLDGQPVPSYGLDALPASLQTAQLPCRLLLPLSTRSDAWAVQPVSFAGVRTSIGWKITDLFLYAPAGQGRGLSASAPVLARYQGAYIDALKAQTRLLDGVTIESCALEPGLYAYPEGGPSFYGVEVTLQLKDIRP